jgi:hypothetical protein
MCSFALSTKRPAASRLTSRLSVPVIDASRVETFVLFFRLPDFFKRFFLDFGVDLFAFAISVTKSCNDSTITGLCVQTRQQHVGSRRRSASFHNSGGRNPERTLISDPEQGWEVMHRHVVSRTHARIYLCGSDTGYRISFTSVRLPRASTSTRVSGRVGESSSSEVRWDDLEC